MEENIFSGEENQSENSQSTPVQQETSILDVLKTSEKKALFEMKIRLERLLLGNKIYKIPDDQNTRSKSKNKTRKPIARTDKCSMELKERSKYRDISLWGVSLLPSKGHEGLDNILLKFLRAREFKVSASLEMLQRTLKWRRDFEIDGILEEDLGFELENVAYMNGTDKKGHPLCYNVYESFKDKELYQKVFGSEEKCGEFLRWRVQFMEKGIQQLSFSPGGMDSMVQITDLKNSPGPAMKEMKVTMKKALDILQDNYPEFVAKNIFINVPFWWHAYRGFFSRILSQKSRNKFIFARPPKVAETLFKYINPENIPIKYGGLQRENDSEFACGSAVSEFRVKSGSTRAIEIPITQAGVTAVWDVTVVGWEVYYKEEFIPDDDCSYRVLIQKEKKLEECTRNSFHIVEPGKIVLTVENRTFKRKSVFYRSKTKPTIPLYTLPKNTNYP